MPRWLDRVVPNLGIEVDVEEPVGDAGPGAAPGPSAPVTA